MRGRCASRSSAEIPDAFLVLGSNLAPERHLPAAVAALAAHGQVVAVSTVWQSPPADGSAQPDYCNAAVWLRTSCDAATLWDAVIPAVEAAGGRVRDPVDRHAPRTIDVDLVLYGDVADTLGRHHLPDPDLFARAFVAVPLAELAPERIVPGDGRSLATIAASLGGDAGLTPRPDIVLPRP